MLHSSLDWRIKEMKVHPLTVFMTCSLPSMLLGKFFSHNGFIFKEFYIKHRKTKRNQVQNLNKNRNI